MKKALVVGGAGFIGSHLVDALVEKKIEVHIIDNLSGGKKENINPKATLHIKDIRNIDDIKPFFKGMDVVFHLAAVPHVQYSIEHPKETHDINVDGMLNVLIASQEAKVKRFVYSASSSAYGDQTVTPLTEDLPAQPKSPYALHKHIGELYCKLWSTVYGLETVSLRYFNVYGPRQNPEGAYASVIGRFLKLKKEGKPLTITGDGKQTRDFISVYDIAKANILAAESKKVGKGEFINIGAGKSFSVNTITELIGGSVEYIPARLEPKDSLANNSLAKKLLGWEPKVTLEHGIAELVKMRTN